MTAGEEMTREPWEDLVDAEQAYIEQRDAMYSSGLMEQQLGLASRSPQGRATALHVLLDAPIALVEAFLEPVFEIAVTLHSPLGPAREVLARLDPDRLTPRLAHLVARKLDEPDPDYPDDDYRRVAELLDRLGQRTLLAELVRRAERSDNPDVVEVADDFRAM
jgi:hypothetical protein